MLGASLRSGWACSFSSVEARAYSRRCASFSSSAIALSMLRAVSVGMMLTGDERIAAAEQRLVIGVVDFELAVQVVVLAEPHVIDRVADRRGGSIIFDLHFVFRTEDEPFVLEVEEQLG